MHCFDFIFLRWLRELLLKGQKHVVMARVLDTKFVYRGERGSLGTFCAFM